MSRPHPIALVGVGKIAQDQHAPALVADARFALVATVSEQGTLPGIPSFDSLDALEASGIAVESVAICTPPQVRAGLARDAIARGWSVLLEKPPTATLAECADLQVKADAAGVTLFAAWHSRFAAGVAAARAWLATRTLSRGEIVWREDVRRWHPGQTWLWAPGGLGVFDPGINALSILTAILPEPPCVARALFDVPSNAHTPIAAQLDLVSGAARVTMDLDFLQTGPQTWEMTFDTMCGHRLHLSAGGAQLAIDGVAVALGAHAEYPALYAAFADLLDARRSDADVAPLRLVADAFLVAERRTVAAFDA